MVGKGEEEKEMEGRREGKGREEKKIEKNKKEEKRLIRLIELHVTNLIILHIIIFI